jgi:LytS/YehU family sensor histidine kinase
MFSLSHTNLIAVIASALLLFFTRKIKSRLKANYLIFGSVIFIAGISIYSGVKIVPPIISTVCSAEVMHDVDKNHIYMVAINIFLSIMIIAAYSMIIIYNKLKFALEKQVREIESLKRLHIEARFAILQSKVNPHFLFNTLNTILALIYKNPKKVESVILNLSEIYRRVLNLPENEAISLEKEINLVKTYLEIEKVRFNKRLQYDLSIAQGLNQFYIPPLIIQTLVENAVIHGISPKKEGGKIQIKANQNDNNIEIIVSDNGAGMKKQQRFTGFGLHCVQERLKLFYKNNALFEITNPDQGGTKIRMLLPYAV